VVGVLGDIHTEDNLLKVALEFLKSLKPDKILAVGDIADGSGNLNRCCKLLQNAGVDCVRGNHDNWLLAGQMRDLRNATPIEIVEPNCRVYLEGLPLVRKYQTIAGGLLLCHGLGKNDMAKVAPDDFGYAIENNADLQQLIQDDNYKFVINGHSHRRMVRSFGYLTIINAGTLRRDHDPCFLIADFQHMRVQYFDLLPDGQIQDSQTFGLSN